MPSLEGEKYIKEGGTVGAALSGLMQLPKARRVELKLAALHRVFASGENEHRQFLLSECIQAYLTLDEDE